MTVALKSGLPPEDGQVSPWDSTYDSLSVVKIACVPPRLTCRSLMGPLILDTTTRATWCWTSYTTRFECRFSCGST